MQRLRDKLVENEQIPGIKSISNRILPPETFLYGKKNIPDKEGVGIGMENLIKSQDLGIYTIDQRFLRLN